MNVAGEDFVDAAGVSGLDHPGDGRSFARLDFDHDGWTDIAVVNANTPMFQLYRNRMGDLTSSPNQTIALRFEGAAREGTTGLTPRDGYGAKVEVSVGDRLRVREHRAGEGFAAQNANTRLIGLGQHDRADRIRVTWPSGQSHEITNVPAGSLVTAVEVPPSTSGTPFLIEPYPQATSMPERTDPITPRAIFRLSETDVDPGAAALTMYVTTATWCGSCLAELPELVQLRRAFPEDALQIIGVPYDDKEDERAFARWQREHTPPYAILSSLPIAEREKTRQFLRDALGSDGLPAATVTDARGRVLLTTWGAPSISALRGLIESTPQAEP